MTLIQSLTPHSNPRSPFLSYKIPKLQTLTRYSRRPHLQVRFSLDELIKTLVSSNPLDLIPSALTLASTAAAFYLSRRRVSGSNQVPVIADWILITSPTPFNRCVLLRCPLISFEEESEKLLREERHYVNLNRGRILRGRDGEVLEEEIGYQRVCVAMEDGGVISLDWPENLDLGKEYGLDTTVLILPGTGKGSLDRDVRRFMVEVLRNGCFPVVVNPRGCAGSPLTTARLFTAADSDDVCTAVKYVNRSRPWTTLMGVGLGYGANMLTKYLAEVGESTPLTAAVCIDNPFDLEEATRSLPHHIAMDQKLLGGLSEILRANKELFQGKAKRFDIAKALSATSVRDFDRAISMVSYGFDSVENFYSVTSTRELIPKLKVPVLFIQSDDGTVPLFSVPRSSIAENPFTSLLLCSCHHPDRGRIEDSAIHWCQQLAIEWLSAVELALLKGRHPLLKDVDVTINPSNGISFINGESSEENIAIQNRYPGTYDSSKRFLSRMNAHNNTWKPTSSNTVNGLLTDQFFNDRDVARGKVNSPSKLEGKLGRMQKGDQGIKEDGDVDTSENYPINSSTTERDSPADAEETKVLQTTAVVMNILDVTMPGTLDDEQKKKVLTAVERGETLMKALEGAVPDDVRGKLTTAVTEIMQTQGTSLNFDGLKRIGWIHNVTSGKLKVQEKSEGTSAAESGQEERKYGSSRDGRTQETIESTPKNAEASQERVGQAIGTSKVHEKSEGTLSVESEQDDACPSDMRMNDTARDGKTQETIESTPKSTEAFHERAGQAAANAEETDSKQSQLDKLEETSGGIDENNAEQYKVNQSSQKSNKHSADEQALDDGSGIHTSETIKPDSSREQNLSTSSTNSEETLSAASSDSEHQLVEKANDIQKNENMVTQDVADPNVQSSMKAEASMPELSSSNPPLISVTQALDALTGFDDSTQTAVNSVFGVIEDMIDQYEEANKQEIGDEVKNNESHEFLNSKKADEGNNKSGIDYDVLKPSNHPENSPKVEQAKSYEEFKHNLKKVSHNLTSSINNNISQVKKNNKAFDLNKVNHANYFPKDVAGKQYWNSLYAAYLHRCYSAQLPMMKSIDSDSTDLFLDPEGRWRMIDQPGDTEDASGSGKNESINGRDQIEHKNGMENIIEPCYVILDNEYSQFEHISAKEYEAADDKNNDGKVDFRCLIRNALLEALKIEVGRRVGGDSDLEDLEGGLVNDLEQFADTVSQTVVYGKELNLGLFSECGDTDSIKFGAIEAKHIIKTISSAMLGANHLQKVLPLGVVVGSCLATLRIYFQVVSLHDDEQIEVIHESRHLPKNSYGQESETKKGISANAINQHVNLDKPMKEGQEKLQADDLNNDGIMVGAVTAALGASALLAHHEQMHENDQSMDVPSVSFSEKGSHEEDIEAVQGKNENSLVSSLSEKAMSVVPTKVGGEVDQERLVAVLAELGQNGGILRLVGKAALLWGGIRGAMSLTDRLISFSHIAKRPLFHRILGFVFMVLVLWSPIVIPLLPTIVQSWMTKTSNGIVDYACILGLYVAITILIILWGKRIRGYQNPLQQYGLELTSSSRIRDFCKGLIGGTMIVVCIHSVNALLGYAQLSWPGLQLSSQGSLVLLKAYGSRVLLVVRGTLTAIVISVVEELLFRSWLAEEVVADFGYYRAILVSGLVFSLCQRSLPSIPGFFLLSSALFGMKQRSGGNLSAPIGARAGIMTANFVIQTGGFLIYRPSTPSWLASMHPSHPFDGVVGLFACAILAIFFNPLPPQRKEMSKDTRNDHQLESEDSSRAAGS